MEKSNKTQGTEQNAPTKVKTLMTAPTLYVLGMGGVAFAKPSEFLKQSYGASLDFHFSFLKQYLQPYTSLSYSYSGGKEHVNNMSFVTALIGLSYQFTPVSTFTKWRLLPHLLGGYTGGSIDYVDAGKASTRGYGVPQITLGVLSNYSVAEHYVLALAVRGGYLFEPITPLPYVTVLLGMGYTF